MSVLRVLVLLMAALCARPAAAGEIAAFDAAGWHIQAFSDEETGKFSDCIAISEYGRTAMLGFEVTHDMLWYMAFSSSSLKVRKGQKPEVSFQVDKGTTYKTRAQVGSKGIVYIPLIDDARLFEGLKKGQTLRITFKDVTLSYTLDSMEPMLKAMQDCPRRFKQAAMEPASRVPADAKIPPADSKAGTPARKPEKNAGREKVYSGSGFFVSRDGMLLTNAHVVEGCTEATITGFGKAAVVATNRKDDLAVLKLANAAKTEPVRFRKSTLQLGEAVYVMGFPLAGQLDNGLNFTSGVISSLAGPGNDVRVAQFTAPSQPGNSGGPVTDASGLVVGVMQSKLSEIAAIKSGGAFPQNVNFGVKSSLAVAFLRANGVEPQEAEAGRPVAAVAVAKDGAAYTVQVKCSPK